MVCNNRPSQQTMSTKATKLNAERAAYQSDCVTQALINGTKAAGWALATAGILVSAANSLSPTFHRALGVSGKAGLIVSILFKFRTLIFESFNKNKGSVH